MKRSLSALLLLLAPVPAMPPAALAVDAQAVDRCHQAIVLGMAAVSRGRVALVSRCMKGLNYDACAENDLHATAHENELRNAVAGDNSACRDAIASGATLADFGPLTCEDSWEDCSTEVPAVSTLEDLAKCLVCQERGFDFEIRDELGLPRPAPDDRDERRCTKRIARLVGYTVRKSIYDTARCARGNAKPFSCPVDATDNSRFGASLAKFPARISRCGIDEGKAPDALANLCNAVATDAASLTTCFEGVARCLACRTANSALGQSEDCAAFSGFAGCDGAF